MIACTARRAAELATEQATPAAEPPDRDANSGDSAAADASSRGDAWKTQFDFDGDGRPDRIDVSFSGGAHCCYTLAVHTTKSDRVVAVPFELDGGYVGGLSLADPKRFAVVKGADGVAKLVMEVAVYAGRPQPIPADWTTRYGIHTHSIEVEIRSGILRARDRH